MHRFGPGLQQQALKSIQDLGVTVILNDRVMTDSTTDGTVALKSGTKLECDLLVGSSRAIVFPVGAVPANSGLSSSTVPARHQTRAWPPA